MTIIAVVAGVVGWTLAEYLLHRFLGHGPFTRIPFAREHLEHHRQREWFAPWRSKLQLAVVVLGALTMLGVPLVGLPLAFTFVGSFVATYLGYEALHRDLHVRAPRTALGRFLRRHHMLHHHMDPRVNHGVTSPVWDVVARTLRPSPRVRVPASKAPWWLLRTDDAVILADYEITGRG
ncbi:MAG TPA: sterol desaturase family protein [Myxococcota bacterium]|nr:sterol desaturase family protein [Myxococcota bacterium]